jgi:hypothetical protein
VTPHLHDALTALACLAAAACAGIGSVITRLIHTRKENRP